MSLVSKSQKLRDALKSIENLKCYHLMKPASVTAPYCVWQEDSEGQSHYANNSKGEQVIQLTVDYFTLKEYDTMIDTIQGALDSSGIAWRLNSFQFEETTNLMHYEWLCEVI